MTSRLDDLVAHVARLERELEAELDRRRVQWRYRIESGRIRFERDVRLAHERVKQSIPRFLRESSVSTLLTAPLIYSLVVPIALLDAWSSLYQVIAFRAYGIARVRRSRYIVIDRQHLAYLNAIEKLNCVYCGYANGVIAYVREIAGRTEQYWCPIRHATRVRDPHEHYRHFIDYGDADGYRRRLAPLRHELQDEPSDRHQERTAPTNAVCKALLVCGILAATLYVAMSLLVGQLWEGYNSANQTISELSAIGAPTRPLWMALGTVYGLLMVAFGWIVWRLAPPSRALRVVGGLLMAQAVFGLFWPPMHQRALLATGGGTLTDTLHIAWTILTVVCFMFVLGFGAVAFGNRFRVYSIATMAIVFASGAWTGSYAARLQANQATPGAGVWERVNTTACMVWIAALAVTLLRTRMSARIRHDVAPGSSAGGLRRP